MIYKAKGKFQIHNVEEKEGKNGKPPFKAGAAVFKVDNSYQDSRTGEYVAAFPDVPFNVFGTSAELTEKLQFDQECEINFEIKGREYQGKYYPEIKALNIKPLTPLAEQKETKADDADIEF